MKNYKWAKILAVTTAALSCVIVLITFFLAYLKQAETIRPNTIITEDLVQNATSVTVKYKSESYTFESKEDVEKIVERFLSVDLNEIVVSAEPEMKGTIVFHTTHPDTKEATTVEIGFDEKLENITLNGKYYTGEKLLGLKNLLVTLTKAETVSDEVEETTEETTAETTTEEVTSAETAFYSTDTQSFDWGGSNGYLAVSASCENYSALIESQEDNAPVIRITNRDELESFAESVSKYFELNIDKYDEDHFVENEIYIIYADEKPKSNDYNVEKVDINGENLDITITYTGTTGTALGSRFIFMSIEKSAVDECTVYNAYIN